MTQDEIIRSPLGREQLVALAREAGLIQYVQVEKTCVSNALERFAALVAAHEREACAKVCEDIDNNMDASWKRNAVNCAAAIRARNSHEKTN